MTAEREPISGLSFLTDRELEQLGDRVYESTQALYGAAERLPYPSHTYTLAIESARESGELHRLICMESAKRTADRADLLRTLNGMRADASTKARTEIGGQS